MNMSIYVCPSNWRKQCER